MAVWCGIPGLIITLLWLLGENTVLQSLVMSSFPDLPTDDTRQDAIQTIMSQVRTLANGGALYGEVTLSIKNAVSHYAHLKTISFMALGVVLLSAMTLALRHARGKISKSFRARNEVERVVSVVLVICSAISIVTTVGIVLSLLFEAMRFFGKIPLLDFLFGLQWSPQTALRADQVGGSGSFGAIPLFVGTGMITLIAMMIAAPVGLLAAIYMSEYASPKMRAISKPLLEVLAGVPTVVYGFFAALTVAPLVSQWGNAVIGALNAIGLNIEYTVASESALAAGAVMGIMVIPLVSSLSDDVINAVPQALREGSYGLGATQAETIKQVILPAALPGIVGAMLLAMSRAIGETMIVVMAAGLSAKMTANPLEAMTTVTVQIVTLLVGDQEFDSAKTLAAFALGLTLFIVTLGLNFIALRIVQKYREQYD
ncbi:putative phosphate ABC transporter permease [Magnetofaba australis IT-1]|uniref:Phosphate transport system permease protein n=1 Tax=Magnetofaba australis IT-1 TaxID=1434232 RepID=A0A1Y2K4R0_9PROT|nr:putative phosphate ABC transporter permease [Magnetofaba australis IT-1]